jgi:DNA (cytosine-5)-methyltransferase 1
MEGDLANRGAGDVAQMKLRVLDLFSGIGGFSLGLERTGGFETVAFCENNKARWPVLQKHWRGIPIYPDVRRLPNDFVVDLVTAGFPCQDISLAGKGAGLAGRRSRLFWRIIRTAGLVGWPRLLLENVAALLDRGLGTVLGALAQVGYDTQWHCIPASAVGAPHVRDRVWISANHRSKREQGIVIEEVSREPAFSWCEDVRGPTELPDRSDLYPSKLCRSRDGISERLDALGNSVVPQIPELIGRAILKSMEAA